MQNRRGGINLSLELFGCKTIREKIEKEKKWAENDFADCPVKYNPEAPWRENAIICRLSLLTVYCETFGIYQILNKEFNDALAEEIKKLGLKPVLEVGAGSGELAGVLRRRGIELIAVDDYSEPLAKKAVISEHPPEKMDYRDALKRYEPELVICSWMPGGEDWTVDFRATGSVKAYILIDDGERINPKDPPGWQSRVLKNPNTWSLCRLDLGVDFERPDIWWRHSKVILFTRDALK